MTLQASKATKRPRLSESRDIEIMVFPGFRKEDPKTVVLRPNGKRFELKRGVWTRVPMACLHALQGACVTKMERVRPEDRGERVIPGVIQSVWIETEIPRFQWQWRELQAAAVAEEDEEQDEGDHTEQ